MTELRLEVGSGPAAPVVTPDRERVRALAGDHRQVPLIHTWLADLETPVGAFLKLRDGGPAFLLESAEEGQRLGRYSIVGVRPQAVMRSAGDELRIEWADGRREHGDPLDPFGAVEDALAGVGMAPADAELAFSGGAVGYFGYDLVRRVERLPDAPPDDLGLDDMVVLITGPVVLFDHLRRSITIVVPCRLGEGDPDVSYDAARDELLAIKERLAGPPPAPRPMGEGAPIEAEVTSNFARADFEAAVEACREYIYAGDAFQIVPSQRFSTRLGLDPFSVYRGLRTVNPSPYMFFFDAGDTALVGSSPETLVKVEAGRVEMHPIAGTRPRGESPAEDARLAAELLDDPKERAEHVMLVDLGRNDLGRVCAVGSVEVRELMTVRHYSHVMHIESSVVGQLAEGRRATDALRATFPAGTLSGAPKVRAMEIIDELEPTRRGPYGGAVGYLGFDGDLDTAITIRTIVCRDGRAHVQAGAGIVADSDPATEYAETQNKAAALFRAIEVAAREPGW